MMVSLDGYIEADSGDIGWSIPDAELRQHFNAGKNMILGGAEVAAAFMDLNLIDEYRIYVHPVVLGRGKEMFQSDKLEVKQFQSGVVLLRYRNK